MTWPLRLLVRALRRRRHREAAGRVRALEVALGLIEPDFVELHADPDLIDWGHGRRARKQRERYVWPEKGGYTAGNVSVSEMGPLPEVLMRPGLGSRTGTGQRSPKGVARPPLVTEQQETPPAATYVPER